MLPTGNRPGDGADEPSLACGDIESKVCLHVPSLRFLTARKYVETSNTSQIPVENIKKYVETIKNVIQYEKLDYLWQDPSLEDKKIDCPEEVFYKLNSTLSKSNCFLSPSWSAFSKSSNKKQLETMRMLIEHNCPFAPQDKDLKEIRQDIPDNHSKVFESIEKHAISPEEALKRAACLEHPKTIIAIIANYPISNPAKKVAFHAAVKNNSLQSCRVLLDLIEPGFDLNQPLYGPGNHDYFLPSAVLYNCSDVVAFLLEHGADVHIYNDKALKNASMFGRVEIIKTLLKYGADIHMLDANNLEFIGLNDFHNFKNKAATLKELLKYGVDITTLSTGTQEKYHKLLADYPEQSDEHTASSSQQISQ